MKQKYKRNTPEEESAINRGIALDPDTWVPTDKDFANARFGRPFLDDPKTPVSIRLDSDVVAHFKAGGKGWQTRINAVLKQAMADSKS